MHFNLTVKTLPGESVERLMAPFCERTESREFLEFVADDRYPRDPETSLRGFWENPDAKWDRIVDYTDEVAVPARQFRVRRHKRQAEKALADFARDYQQYRAGREWGTWSGPRHAAAALGLLLRRVPEDEIGDLGDGVVLRRGDPYNVMMPLELTEAAAERYWPYFYEHLTPARLCSRDGWRCIGTRRGETVDDVLTYSRAFVEWVQEASPDAAFTVVECRA